MAKIIYDFGANNGDDIPYYLMRADLVVAIEGDPILCDAMNTRFRENVENGELVIENCVVADRSGGTAVFHRHKADSVLSQFPEPSAEHLHEYERINVRASTAADIVARYGAPFYVKVDLEHYDQMVLRNLFENGIRPDFISAESHDIEVFSILLTLGNYHAFNLVDGNSVRDKYGDCAVLAKDGKKKRMSFPFHSAGPFGEDLKGDWMTPNEFFKYLAFEGLGWKDVHATRVIDPNPGAIVHLRPYVQKAIHGKFKQLLSVLAPS